MILTQSKENDKETTRLNHVSIFTIHTTYRFLKKNLHCYHYECSAIIELLLLELTLELYKF